MGAPRVSTALFGREKTKHSRQGPGKRSLPGQKDKAPGKRSLPGQGGKAPARGACRDDRTKASRPRQVEFAGKAVPGSRLLHVTPSMRLYLPRVEARLRGI